MNALATTPENRNETLHIADAQVEVFWLAFQALPKEAQFSVRQRLLALPDMPEELTAELESWQAAASEALLNFKAMLREA